LLGFVLGLFLVPHNPLSLGRLHNALDHLYLTGATPILAENDGSGHPPHNLFLAYTCPSDDSEVFLDALVCLEGALHAPAFVGDFPEEDFLVLPDILFEEQKLVVSWFRNGRGGQLGDADADNDHGHAQQYEGPYHPEGSENAGELLLDHLEEGEDADQ